MGLREIVGKIVSNHYFLVKIVMRLSRYDERKGSAFPKET